jgi:uncharacterized protein YndB with AHSA1/START domain
MSNDKSTPRPPQTHEIEIDAPPDAVWNAISTGEGLTRWYGQEARVEPRVGGEHFVSWGEGMDVGNENLVWEPGKRLRIGKQGHETATGWKAIVVDFEVEARGGRTLLKLVQSGLPAGPDWDSMDDGTDVGWEMFLAALKFAVERHAGKARRTISRYWASKQPAGAMFESLRALLGIAASDLREGARYSATTAGGEKIGGQIVGLDQGHLLAASVDELGDALATFTVHATGEGAYVNFIVGTFGLSDAQFADAKARWTKLLEAAA